METITNYELLRIAEAMGFSTVEIVEKSTGKSGVANSSLNAVAVFYGADDGSDDKTISPEDFNRDFEIKNIIKR